MVLPPRKPTDHARFEIGYTFTPSEALSFTDKPLTIISCWDKALESRYPIQSIVNWDKSRSVCISADIKSNPRDELVCFTPFVVKDLYAKLESANFDYAHWVVLDVDNDKNPADNKWTINRITEYLSARGYTFFIQASKTDGNYKVYIQTAKIDDWKLYQETSKYANSMEEGLGDPQFQHIQSFVKGFICGHRGDKLFTINADKTAVPPRVNKVKRVVSGKSKVNSTQAVYGGVSKDEIYLKGMKGVLMGKNTIRGRVEAVIARANGTFTLELEGEVKSKGSYWIAPENGFMVYKAGGGSWKPKDFFTDKKEQAEIYKFMCKIGNVPSRIVFINDKDEGVAQEEFLSRIIKRNDGLRKVGATKKTTWKGGVKREYWVHKQVRYYTDKKAEMMILVKAVWSRIIKIFSSSLPSFLSKGSSFSMNSSSCYCICSRINNLVYKGRTEDQKKTTHDFIPLHINPRNERDYFTKKAKSPPKKEYTEEEKAFRDKEAQEFYEQNGW